MDTAYSYGNERLTNERFTGWTGYYTYDPRGSVTGVTDSEGMIWQSYRYDANGSMTFGQPQYNNVYSYNAESYNPNMDAQYLRARYYSPTTADFISEDSYLGDITDPLTLNRYNYVKSSPLNYVDPSGRWGGVLQKAISYILMIILMFRSQVMQNQQLVIEGNLIGNLNNGKPEHKGITLSINYDWIKFDTEIAESLMGKFDNSNAEVHWSQANTIHLLDADVLNNLKENVLGYVE